jgi:hypothetical protein
LAGLCYFTMSNIDGFSAKSRVGIKLLY